MGEHTYLKFILTVLTAALIFFGYVAIRSFERLRLSNLQIREELTLLRARLERLDVPAVTAGIPPRKAQSAAVPAANAAYFDAQAQPGGSLVQAVSADTANLNTLLNNDALAAEVCSYCTAALAERDFAHPEEFQPLLAESWTISPDKREFRIRLRRGVKWDDFTDPVTGKSFRNREVTADDFAFFFEVVRNPEVNCEPLRVYYRQIEKVTVNNPYEFTVRWDKPYYGAVACTLGLTPLPRHFYDYGGGFDAKKFNNDHLRNRMIVGCGPYRFLRWEKDQRLILQRNLNYFGNALGVGGSIEYLCFDVIKVPNTRFQALLAGKLDQLSLTPDQWFRRTDNDDFRRQFQKFRYQQPVYSYIGWNARNPLFQDVRVRRALTMLTDRERMLRELYFNLGKVVAGPFFPEGRYCDPAIRPWPYDPVQAKKLLTEAGWKDTDDDGILEKDGRKFVFTMLQIASHPIQQRMMPMLKESFAAAGIDMKIQNVEWSVLIQRLNSRTFDACSLGWASSFEPDLYQIFHSSQADLPNSSNHVSYRSRAADELIEKLRVTFDPAERVKLSHRLGAVLHAEQPYTFLIAPYSLTALSRRYRNAKVFPVGLPDVLLWVPAKLQRRTPGI